ncbi:MAG: OadG family protein [Clostridia bacterium]|nr:OadG family protein [Clostridia bacterium]
MFLAVDVTKPLESAGDKFAYGGQMLLIGMSVVFSVLLLLWGALELFHLIVTKLPAALEKKRNKETAYPTEPILDAAIEDDDETVAVIAAAIAAAGEENPSGSFRVVSFRRV